MKATIYIEGIIGEDTTLLSVMRQFKSFKNPSEVDVIVNSVGGSVDDGQAIFNYLRNLDIPVTTIARQAYSIAASIFMAGDKRIVEEGDARVMIHMPWANIAGRADDFERMASLLREVETSFVEFYSKYIEADVDSIRNLLSKETYLSAQEALELGLATEIQVPLKAVAYLTEEETINNNNNKSTIMKNIDKLITALKAFGKEEEAVVALILQDANGTELVFPELAEDESPEVGDKAEIDGKPASGEFVNPDGSSYVFENGELMEIKMPEPAEEEETPAEEPEAQVEASTEEPSEEEEEEEIDVQAMLDGIVERVKVEVKAEMESTIEGLQKTNTELNDEIVALKKLISSDDLTIEKQERFESNITKGMSRAAQILASRKQKQ